LGGLNFPLNLRRNWVRRAVISSIAGFGLLVTAVAAMGAEQTTDQPAAASTQPAATTPAPDNSAELNQVECRTGPAPTGTRLGGTRVCRTRKEWNEIMHLNQDALTNFQIHNTINPKSN
jgi:hypothetical protein